MSQPAADDVAAGKEQQGKSSRERAAGKEQQGKSGKEEGARKGSKEHSQADIFAVASQLLAA